MCGWLTKPHPPRQEATPAVPHGAHRITVESLALVHPPPHQAQGDKVAFLPSTAFLLDGGNRIS